MSKRPSLAYESARWAEGYRCVAGIDEAGRGALAGPVVAAAVALPPGTVLAADGLPWSQVRDSKQLAPARRETLFDAVQQHALACAIGCVDAATIDSIGIAAATRRAMQEAVVALAPASDALIIDWVKLPSVNLPQQSFIKADQRVVSVAAASILAKVYRDRLLVELGARYPAYGFAQHKGYGTAQHRAAIATHGPCPVHRHTFAPIAQPRTLFAPTQH